MNQSVGIVTGANRGIGRASAIRDSQGRRAKSGNRQSVILSRVSHGVLRPRSRLRQRLPVAGATMVRRGCSHSIMPTTTALSCWTLTVIAWRLSAMRRQAQAPCRGLSFAEQNPSSDRQNPRLGN